MTYSGNLNNVLLKYVNEVNLIDVYKCTLIKYLVKILILNDNKKIQTFVFYGTELIN